MGNAGLEETAIPPRGSEDGAATEQGGHARSGSSNTPSGPFPVADTTGLGPSRAHGQQGRLSTDSLPCVTGYEVLAEIGRGGMGVVYRARQIGVNRMVALKMVSRGPLELPNLQARFRLEAEAVAQLDHPHIIPVYEVGEHEGHPYFSMKLVEGGSLQDHLARCREPRTAAGLVATVARAVHYAHQRGILHRDLKPSNILLDRKGEPHVTDFGLAKRVASTENLTASGFILGTPGYMAPEQAGSGKALSVATDVWGLGSVLYVLVTGRAPFEAATPMETVLQVLDIEPPRPRSLVAGLDRDLETICLTCLAKDPERRYPSAEALADDLERWLRVEPIQARPVGLVERTLSWARRRPAVAALALVALLTASSGVTGITIAWRHAVAGWGEADRMRDDALAKRVEAETQRARAEQEQAKAEQRREVAETSVYFSRVTQARLERELNHPDTAQHLLESCLPNAETPTDRRGWEWHYLQGVLHSDLLTIPKAHEDMVTEMAFSPASGNLATGGGSPYPTTRVPDRVRIWQLWGTKAGACLREFPHPIMIRSLAYSRDGRRVAWVGIDGAIRQADATTGETLVSRQLPDDFGQAYLSPHGTRYAAASESGKVVVWEVGTGKQLASLPAKNVGAGAVRHLAFSPDEQWLATRGPQSLQLWDTATGKEIRAFKEANDSQCRPAFSPDGRLLAIGTRAGSTRIWDIASGQLLRSPAGHVGTVLAAAFSPESTQLATGGADGCVRVWNVANGREILLLRGHYGRVGSLCFHPSGTYLASGGEQPADVKIWDLTRPQEYVRVPQTPAALGRIEAIGLDKDNSMLLVARSSGRLQVNRADTGLEHKIHAVDLTGANLAPFTPAAFSDDGRLLATISRSNGRIVKLSNGRTGEVLCQLEHNATVKTVAFSRDGNWLVTGAVAMTGEHGRQLSFWDTRTGQRQTNISYTSARAAVPVALSPHGTVVVHTERGSRGDEQTGPMDRIRFRDAVTGESRLDLDGVPGPIQRLAYSTDGYRLAVASDRGVTVYDARAGRWLHARPLSGSTTDESFNDLAFSPDSLRLAAVSRTETLVWDVATGQLVVALKGAPPRPSDNRFNPRIVWSQDGRRLAASNWDHSVSIWDSADRQSPAAKEALHQAAEARAQKPEE